MKYTAQQAYDASRDLGSESRKEDAQMFKHAVDAAICAAVFDHRMVCNVVAQPQHEGTLTTAIAELRRADYDVTSTAHGAAWFSMRISWAHIADKHSGPHSL